MAETVRIFTGCAPNNEDLESQAVLEWSLRKHASMPIEITWMQLSHDKESPWYCDPQYGLGWNIGNWATPFSGFRWAIPHVCNFEGKALYTDSDMIALADIAELWRQEFKNDAPCISKGRNQTRYCVTLFNCAAMKRHVLPFDRLKRTPMGSFMVRQSVMSVTQPFKGNWNCLDGEHYKDIHDPDIKILHYTSIPHQLHLKHSIPRLQREGNKHWYPGRTVPHFKVGLQEMFDELLVEAIANGYPPERYRKEPFGDYRTRWAAA